jgi:hypothetical protein
MKIQSYLNAILDPNEKSISRYATIIGFFITMYGLKLMEERLKIYMSYLIRANLLVDILILCFIFSIMVYLLIKFDFRFKALKMLIVMLISVLAIYSIHTTINQFTLTSLKLREVSLLPISQLSMSDKNVMQINETEKKFSINFSQIKFCRNVGFDFIIRKNYTCSVKASKQRENKAEKGFFRSNTFLSFMFKVILLIFVYLITMRILIWLVLEIPEKKSDENSLKAAKIDETKVLVEVQNQEIESNDSIFVVTQMQRQSFAKKLSAKCSEHQLSISHKIKRKHFDTAKKHSYSMDNLDMNTNNKFKKSNTTSLVSLESENLKCYDSCASNLSTVESRKDESILTLNNYRESLYTKMDNVYLINWILLNGIDSKFGKMLFANFLNKTVQDLVCKYLKFISFLLNAVSLLKHALFMTINLISSKFL